MLRDKQYFKLTETKVKSGEELVIDGFGLTYYFKRLAKADGTRTPVHDIAVEFFHKLDACGIRPTLFFDGPHVDRDIQRRTSKLQRRTSRLRYRHQKQKSELEKPLPEYRTVGCSVLVTEMLLYSSELRRLFNSVVACGVTDREIVQYANKHDCPVLGGDSDFYIFEIQKGYIQFEDFEWKSARTENRSISAGLFLFEDFAKCFDIPEQHRFLIPAILGNDCIRALYDKCKRLDLDGLSADLKDFMSSLRIDPADKNSYACVCARVITYASCACTSLHQYRTKPFSELLSGFGREDPTSMVPELQQMGNFNYQTLIRNCKDAEEFYNICGDHTPSNFPTELLPEWAWEQFRHGRLSITVVEVLAFEQCFLTFINQDLRKVGSSSHSIGENIRTYTYGILLGPGKVVVEKASLKKSPCYTDIHHCLIDARVRTKVVDPIMELKTMAQFSTGTRKQILCRILSCCPDEADLLPRTLQLIAIVTRYWYCTAKPEENIAKAVIASFVFCKDGGSVQKLVKWQHTCTCTYENYLKIFHALAQWQQVYLDTLTLNQVLMEAFDCEDHLKFYSGDVVQYFYFSLCKHELGDEVKEDYEKLLSFVMDTNAKLKTTAPNALVPKPKATFETAYSFDDEDDGDDEAEEEEEEEKEEGLKRRRKRWRRRREGRGGEGGEGAGGGGDGLGESMSRQRSRRRRRRKRERRRDSKEGKGGGRETEEEEAVEVEQS